MPLHQLKRRSTSRAFPDMPTSGNTNLYFEAHKPVFFNKTLYFLKTYTNRLPLPHFQAWEQASKKKKKLKWNLDHAKRSERSSRPYGQGSRGPLKARAPGGVQGQRPGGGRGGEAPWSPRLFGTLKCTWGCILAPYLAIISTHFSYKICILRQVCRILSMLPFWIKVFYIISSILGDLQPPITTSCGPIIGHWQVTKAPPERRPECFYEPEPLSTQV